MRSESEPFPPGVADKLKTYVYRLIDPRNGETFYIGKGKGNRVFDHIREKIDERESGSGIIGNKMKRIRAIRRAGFEVAHVIHRHGMDEKTAVEVEAALIDAYPGLTNIVDRAGSSDYGAMHAREIIEQYSAEPAVFQHKAVLISVNKTATGFSLYEVVRFAWKMNMRKAKEAELVLATVDGIIRGVFVPDEWLEATAANFPGPRGRDRPGRIGFVGHEAPPAVVKLYVGKRVPDEYRKRGAANPVKYTWGKKTI